ncbi:myb-like protein A isoform X2 [Folsomia candida]|uniref:myb-like protein A isoform X2 n=1 Tax=Folsomia candida TaxID=158441 RepID=UPI000B903011|nr:myb-like protein A isoform X2 [Folsomia candida]
MCEAAKKEEVKKIGDGTGVRLGRNPKQFLTWSATAANNRLQRMSKTLANNITRLQMKMEKAIPFQPGVGGSSGEYCSKSCENGKLENFESCGGGVYGGRNLNDKDENKRTSPDVVVNMSTKLVNTTGVTPPSWNASYCGSDSNDVKFINKMVKQLGEIGRYQYDTRIQSARIVQSHPSVSQIHSHGSVANPDKIIQINVESYHAYSCEEIDKTKVTSDNDCNNVDKSESVADEIHKKIDKILDMRPPHHLEDLFYDSGTGSANTSISGSSLSSPTVSDSSPANNSSVVPWNRATEESSSSSHNLNSFSPFVISQKLEHDSSNKSDFMSNPGSVKKVNNSNASRSVTTEKDGPLLTPLDYNNSTNSGVSSLLDSTDERSLLLENRNKSSHNKRGLRNNGSKNVEICNHKNAVESSKPENNLDTSKSNLLRLKSLNFDSYPPSSKLAITIFEKEGELRHALWFQAGIPREIALEILRNEPIGCFIVRESTTKPGCFALSLRVPKEYQPCGIAHYLILKSSRGYKIKGFTKEFPTLTAVVHHHSILKELLPVPLSGVGGQVKSLRVSRANSTDFMEPEKLFIGKYTDF